MKKNLIQLLEIMAYFVKKKKKLKPNNIDLSKLCTIM